MPDNGVQLLESLRSLGITVRVVGMDRLSLEPASRIPADMVPRIREAKPAILQALRKQSPVAGDGIAACGSPYCAGCYDVGDGRKIHPPKCGADFLRWRAWLEGKGPKQ